MDRAAVQTKIETHFRKQAQRDRNVRNAYLLVRSEALGVDVRVAEGRKFVTVPLLMPARFNCWGCTGVTGAFMFFHPRSETYIIGSFNDSSYRSKALRYMHGKVIRPLLACR